MTLGLPVIISSVSSLFNVVSLGGILVDPLSVDQICEAIFRLASDKSFYEKLCMSASEQAKSFSWELVAAATLFEIEQLISE